MDPSSNFSSYRSTLKAAMWRSAGATDQRQRIVIPFFSLLVKDLYFLNEGCSSRSVHTFHYDEVFHWYEEAGEALIFSNAFRHSSNQPKSK